MKGRCFLTRFADDFVIGCELEADAHRIMEVLPKRFSRFSLTIHPEKKKLIKFSRPDNRADSDKSNGTFDFLGFTHYWTKSRQGYWVIKRQTASKRLRKSMKRVWQWCRTNRHMQLAEQYRKLCQKLKGHYQYYGIRGNYQKLSKSSLNYSQKQWIKPRIFHYRCDNTFDHLLSQSLSACGESVAILAESSQQREQYPLG